MEFMPFCSTEICFTTLEGLQAKLLGLNAKHMTVIANDSAVKRWNLQGLLKQLAENYDLTWINHVSANPTQWDLITALEQIETPPDLVIALGGGSVIDLAKGISALYDPKRGYSYEEITHAIRNKLYLKKDHFIKIIAVPSTAGTGSEVTSWATIWDGDKQSKYSIDAPGLKPTLALIVPELTLTASANLTLCTGLDALSHAVEAYWSKHTNPLVQELAYRAVELILGNLRTGIKRPDDLAVRELLCRGSVLAGLAFSQTRTTACHSLSYPLTMLYDIPHGLAAAMTLDPVSRMNEGHYPNDGRLMALFAEYGGISGWINQVCLGVVQPKLSAFGITTQDLHKLVERSFTGGRMDNNPVDLSPEDVMGILKSVL